MQFRYQLNNGPQEVIKNLYTNIGLWFMLQKSFQDYVDNNYLELNYRLISAQLFEGVSVYDDAFYKNWNVFDQYIHKDNRRLEYIWKPEIIVQNSRGFIRDTTQKSMVIGKDGTVVGLAMMILPGRSQGFINDVEVFMNDDTEGWPFSMALFPSPIHVTFGDFFTVNYEMVW